MCNKTIENIVKYGLLSYFIIVGTVCLSDIFEKKTYVKIFIYYMICSHKNEAQSHLCYLCLTILHVV